MILTELDNILDRWKEYCSNLYKDDSVPQDNIGINKIYLEPSIYSILYREVESAISKLRNNKSPGDDQITSEMIKVLGDRGVSIITAICNKIWQTVRWPVDWTSSTLITFYKK